MSPSENNAAKALRDQVSSILLELHSLDVSNWSMNDIAAEKERHQVAIGEALLIIASERVLPKDMTDAIEQAAGNWSRFKAATRSGRLPVSEWARHRRNERYWFVCWEFIGGLKPVMLSSTDRLSHLSMSERSSEAYREHLRCKKRKLELKIFSTQLENLIAWIDKAIEESPNKGTASHDSAAPKKPDPSARKSHYHPIFTFNDDLKAKSRMDLTRRQVAKAYIESLSPRELASERKDHGDGKDLEDHYVNQLRNHKNKLKFP